MQVDEIAKQFPIFAQGWAEKRLKRYFNLHAQLPPNNEIIGVKDYLNSLTEDDRIHQTLNKVAWQDAVKRQEKWHDTLARKSVKMAEFGGDAGGKAVLDCSDGYKWVEIKTSEQFDFEGNAMGHCIGQGGYDDSKNRFFSLRDKNNLPHVTIEFNPEDNKYVQIQGRANERVIEDYFEHCGKIFKHIGDNGWDALFEGSEDNEFIIIDNKPYFDQDVIEDALENNAHVDYVNLKWRSYGILENGKIMSLASYMDVDEIPEDTIFKNVRLTADSVCKWQHKVTGDFVMLEAQVHEINEKAWFGGIVDIIDSYLNSFNATVMSNLQIIASEINTIGSNTKIHGRLRIIGTKIDTFNASVYDTCSIHKSSIKKIGHDAEFNKELILKNSDVEPLKIQVKGSILDYSKTQSSVDNMELN